MFDAYFDFLNIMSTVGSDTFFEGIIKNNVILGGIIYGALKVFAILTPSNTDNKILSMFQGVVNKSS